ncbi:hypothetical protein E2562_006594 [Oryza meyeriana var. granulata]|uniref:Uncharacterized protein n=1 Tax=Oryza meyeriana var. granulata TaxID=110450 RepID=A0A6G1EEU9_9ORYZ|nr:hypothetical protein E2562_006594 [Oryza meyeriana var. granulata]
MDNSAERKLEKLHSLCLVLGKNFEQLTEEELGALSENNEYSTKLDLLLQRMSDLKSFRIAEEAAPGVEMNLQVHQAPQPVMNPQPQQIEAQAEGVDVPYLPNPVGMNVPRSARTPRVLVEPQPPAPAEPHQAAPAEPDLHRPLLASDSSGSSEDPDDPNDPDYAP